MSSLRRSFATRLRVRAPRGFAFVLAFGLALVLAPVARGGADDFDFGKKLAESRYFDYARLVYENILADASASEARKDEARYGLALLKKQEALAAAARPASQLDEVIVLFEGASQDIEAFVKKNPKNKRANEARLDIGTIRLAFVQWARELLDDPGEIADRGYDSNRLRDAASASVDKAIEYFGQMRPDPNDPDPEPHRDLANYYYVISQYYRALVEEPCSDAAIEAFQSAGNLLEEYIMDHDGQLLAIYAQDIYGLVWWKLAQCAENDEKKTEYFNKAFEWFETCIFTEDEGKDFLRVITSGFYHIAQAGLDAGRMPKRNFARDGMAHLERMLDMHPTAWRTDNGVRAIIEWSKLECARGNASRAVEIALDAAELAKKDGRAYLERLANRQLNEYVSGSCGGSVGGLNPEVLRRVADDLFLRQRYPDAIRAYRAVVDSAPDTAEGFVDFKWHAWEQMARGYREANDPLGQALALEPIHDAWRNGLIPRTNKENDPNLKRAGDDRRAAQMAIKTLAEKTGSSAYQARYRDMRDNFGRDYKGHGSETVGAWNAAIDRWNQALTQKKAKNPQWRSSLNEARSFFRQVSKQTKSERQDAAWVFLVRCDIIEDKYDQAVKTANEAFAAWETPAAKEQAEKFPTVRTRREAARGEITYWVANAYAKQEMHEEVAKTLANFHKLYPDARDPYPWMAYGDKILANLALGNIEEADRDFRTLLRLKPDFQFLPIITFKFADHFNAQRKVIEDELRQVTTDLNENRKLLRAADKELNRAATTRSDLNKQLKKYDAALELKEKNDKIRAGGGRPDQPVNPDVLRKALDEKESGELKKRVEDLTKAVNKSSANHDEFQAEVTKLLEQKTALEQEIYTPLSKAASYYKAWDDALKILEKDQGKSYRSPDNLGVFAYMWWSAGRLRPEVRENWENAKSTYEDYLNDPRVKKLPVSDEDKRSALARLGDTYVNLAETATDAAERKALVTRAVDLLQNAISKRPEDNDLVVSMMANKVLVLTWKDRSDNNRMWRFPIPRPATVKELRDAVKKIGKDDDPYPRRFANAQKQEAYKKAITKFRTVLAGTDDGRLRPSVQAEGKSLLDPALYREIANSSPEFRIALAWAYAHTGREEDVVKALNLLISLTRGPLAAEEDSEIWWRSYDTLMRLYLETAKRHLGSGTTSAEAAEWLERGKSVFQSIAANYPDLGEIQLKGSRDRWLDYHQRLDGLRQQAGLPAVEVDIGRLQAGGATEETGSE